MFHRSAKYFCASVIVLSGLAAAGTAYGQAVLSIEDVQALRPAPSIARNGVANMSASGDSLWVGPLLHVTFDGGRSWYAADADSVSNGRGRMFSIDTEGQVIWVGLGYSSREQVGGRTQSVHTAGGFVFSEDGGNSWTYRPVQFFLDQETDTVEVYGVSTLPALPVIVPQQSPPYYIDYDPVRGTVWAAAWASGIRRSDDTGLSWNRVVLPPDTLFEIHPDRHYNFMVAPQRRPDEAANNYLGFSVLVDEDGTVWAGTAAGINRSLDGGLSWRRFVTDDSPDSPVGNWITSMGEQRLPGQNAIWFGCWPADARFESHGVTVTRDGGETFERVLVGEKVYDFAFRGETVYAAGDNGLFISEDGGRTWRTVRHFRDAEQPDRLVRPDVQVLSVETTNSALWVGTSDGLMRSEDGGQTWRLFRAEVPLAPEEGESVETYAYPNPYSPSAHHYLRIKYELDRSQRVSVRIFDFGMNLVRTLADDERAPGFREETWDGTDDRGMRVANGPYIYVVRTDDRSFSGKILVLE